MDYLKLFVVVIVLVVNFKEQAPHAFFKFVLHDGLLWWKSSFKDLITDTLT